MKRTTDRKEYKLLLGGLSHGEPHVWISEDPVACKAEIDKVAAAKGNVFRCTLAHFKPSGDLFMPFNMPSGTVTAAQLVVNPLFFTALNNLFSYCKSVDVCVQVEFWDRWNLRSNSSTRNWWRDVPWSKLSDQTNNTNPNEFNAGFFTAGATSETGKAQRRFIDLVTAEGDKSGNVIYQIANESDTSDLAWNRRLVEYVHAKGNIVTNQRGIRALTSSEHLAVSSNANADFVDLSQNGENGPPYHLYPDAFWDALLAYRTTTNITKPINNTKIYARKPDGNDYPEVAVDRMVMDILAGSASASFHKDPSVGSTEPALQAMGAVRAIDERTDVTELQPVARNSGKWQNRPGGRAFAAIGPNYAVVYVTGNHTGVTFDTSSFGTRHSVFWIDVGNYDNWIYKDGDVAQGRKAIGNPISAERRLLIMVKGDSGDGSTGPDFGEDNSGNTCESPGGAELIPGSNFSSSLDGWAPISGINVSRLNGAMKVANKSGAVYGIAQKTFVGLIVGFHYSFKITFKRSLSNSGARLFLNAASASGTEYYHERVIPGSGDVIMRDCFTATSRTLVMRVRVDSRSTSGYCTFDDGSLKRI